MKVLFTLRSIGMMLMLAVFTCSAVAAAVPASNMSVPSSSAYGVEAASATTMNKKEKKAAKKALKQKLKDLKANLKSGNLSDTDTLLLVILSILLPPLAVFLYEGAITSRFWISLILTLIFWIPGVIYSLLVVLGAI